MKRFLSLLLTALMLLGTAASAEELELTGTASSLQTITLTSPAAGKVESCTVSAGDRVEAGTALLTLQTTKVYAEQDGTVRVFGQPGDSVTALTTRYGGVAYVEPAQRYTIAASTKNAYGTDDTRYIHAGETAQEVSRPIWGTSTLQMVLPRLPVSTTVQPERGRAKAASFAAAPAPAQRIRIR